MRSAPGSVGEKLAQKIRATDRRSWVLGGGVVILVVGVCLLVFLFNGPTEPVDLERYERSVFSQGGEDGVIEKIFEIIEPTHKYAVEFGGGDGITDSNVRHLFVNKGWSGLLMEGDEERAAKSKANYRDYPNVKSIQTWVYPGNVELLLEENGVPKDLDLLVIDIDSNDWYVWRAIRDFRPKVVQIEYNGRIMPPTKMVVDFHPMNYWDRTLYHGASIQSFYELGKKKGYELVYANKKGINLFFVDEKYFKRFGIKDNSPEKIYRKHLGKTGIRPDKIHRIIDEDGVPRGRHGKDLVWEEIRIKKRFRLDR